MTAKRKCSDYADFQTVRPVADICAECGREFEALSDELGAKRLCEECGKKMFRPKHLGDKDEKSERN